MSPPTQPATCIDDLPLEMVNELFKYLPLKHLVTCSLVNKRWHSIYVAFKVHRLAATDEARYDSFLIKWSHPDRTIQEEERCPLATFVRLAEQPLTEHHLLSNLKCLALVGVLEFDLNKLNKFDRLVHLETRMPISSEVHLHLPKLKVLVFYLRNMRCALSIDCPQLSVLAYGEPADRKLLKVKHPETIRKLQTSMLGSKLAPFKSVECLVTRNFDVISKATLQSLPALKELHYNESIENTFKAFTFEFEILNRIRRTLEKFLEDVQVLKGSDFRFRFTGFPLTKAMLNQIDFGVQVFEGYNEDDSDDESVEDDMENPIHPDRVSNEYVYLRNQQLIDGPLEFLTELNYTSLISRAAGQISSGFCEKLTCVQSVYAKKVEDTAHFLWFLKQLRSLRKLKLKNSRLDQQFFDRLPASARSLARLELLGDSWATEHQLNFDFVSELSNLSRIKIENRRQFKSFRSLADDWSIKMGFFSVSLERNPV